MRKSFHEKGFSLVETLVAVSLLTIAITAPMALASKSLTSAYYARDQITAFYLAQEAIEAVRAVRDGQILQIAQSANATGFNIFGPIPQNAAFMVDARKSGSEVIVIPLCDGGLAPTYGCLPLQTDGNLYGYGIGTNTAFTRAVQARLVDAANSNEIRVTVTVSWKSGTIQRSFTISEDMYRWIEDGVSQQ